MTWDQISRKAIIAVAMAGLFVGLLGIAQATVSVINQLAWNTAVQITTDTQNGNGPDMMVAPNGNMMIVYSQWVGNSASFSNPYFSQSTDGGQNWTAVAPILGTPNNISQVFVEGTYDAQSVPHVIWVDFTPGTPFPTSRVIYTRRAGNNWTTPTILSSRNDTPVPSKHAEIVASAAQTLDVVWDEEDKLYHRRSTDGGNSWGVAVAVPETNAVTNELRLATDGAGSAFAVWEQKAGGADGGTNIFFSKFDGASWATPIMISTNAVEVGKSAFPAVAVSATKVTVSYSYRLDTTSADAPQFVVTKSCLLTSNCSQIANWTSPQNISNKMFVNAEDPYFVVPDMAYDPSVPSVFAYYHGIPADGDGNPFGNNEAIFGRNSCLNWGEEIDQATPFNERSGNPAVAAQNRNVYLTYELVIGDTDTGKYRIMFNRAPFNEQCVVDEPTPTPTTLPIPTRGPGDIMLPAIFRR
ncbi:MAG: exo-alpha-sialidase [Anaerolineales bacterium]|nr:exo-alpha-sialidase [Anaerolineales bacterium]